MISTEKTRQILIDNGAPEECPRDFWTEYKLKPKYRDDGMNYGEEDLLSCSGFVEGGYVHGADEHRHPACAECTLRSNGTKLSRKKYLKLIDD